MARLVNATCPRCGALVPVEPNSDRATCSYCGAVTTVAKTEQVPVHVPVPPAPVRSSGAATAIIVVFAIIGVVVMAVGAGVWMLVSRATDAVNEIAAPIKVAMQSIPPASAPGSSPSVPSVPPALVTSVSSAGELLAVDVDGDRRPEIVSSIQRRVGSESTEHYAVFDAQTGAERAHTPAIEGLRNALVGGVGNRLVLAGDNGQLTGYDLVSGDSQWTTALGERVAALCEAREPGSIHVETNDGRNLTVDLTTGRQVVTRDPCARLLARSRSFHDPRDRRDHSAPRGVEAWQCGGVTVMGSESYRVPDACLARGHVDTDRLDGMGGHRIWKQGAGWIVFGVRRPGAYVPMVGLLQRGAFVWKAEVPLANPLEADTGGPDEVALVADTLAVAYGTRPNDTQILTAFSVADGTRRWTVPLTSGHGSPDLVALDDAVVARIGGVMRIVAAGDGAVRATIGTEP